jgi:hypothetical protein
MFIINFILNEHEEQANPVFAGVRIQRIPRVLTDRTRWTRETRITLYRIAHLRQHDVAILNVPEQTPNTAQRLQIHQHVHCQVS